jgi:hypothetical protein
MFVKGRYYANFGSSLQNLAPYQRMEAQRYNFRQTAGKAVSSLSGYSTQMFSATLSLSQGLSQLVAQSVIDKTQKSLAAKQTQMSNISNSANSLDVTA